MTDDELRFLFGRLRESDSALTPDFSDTLARAARRPGARYRWRAAGTIGLLAAGIAFAVWLGVRSQSPGAPSIMAWRAPTDVFLRPLPGSVLEPMPALGASVLDSIIQLPRPRGD